MVICLVLIFLASASPAQTLINPKLRTIFVVGDSTANNNANGGQGWGDPFVSYFDLTKVNVVNRARAGRSSRTFITEGLWDNVLSEMKPEVVHTYGWYLRRMISDTKAKGAIPIVLSLTVRNIWKDGHVERGSGMFGQWAAEIAKSQNVLFLDVTKLIADKYEELGEEKVKELFATDHTHTNPAGAELNASLIVAGLKTIKGKPFNRYLNRGFRR
jgi:rhamnogalacturonan acetylesterase